MQKKIRGTGVAIITPFHKDGSIDFTSLEKIIEHQISGNINYLVVLGTTGESVTLNKDEKNAVVQFTIDIVDKRVPIVMGIGGNNTQEIVNTMKSTDYDGIDAILSVSPYYNKPPQKGIFQHYKTIASVCPLPIIIYNVPGRTGCNITADTTLRIANEIENTIGVKEASGNMDQCMKIIKNRPKGFLVISGDDNLTLPLIAAGADGVISVVANAFPAEYSEMVQSALAGHFKKAQELHYKYYDFVNALFAEGSPGGIKAAMEHLGLCQNFFRLPIVGVSKTHYNSIGNILESLK